MKSKEIVITGAAGFVGEALASKCLASGISVCQIDSFWDSSRPKSINSIDLRGIEIKELAHLFKGSVVVHLASFSTNEQCMNQPLSAIDVNCLVTAKVVEACNASNSPLIFASTEWLYPDLESNDEIQAEDYQLSLFAFKRLYPASKFFGEWYVRSFVKTPFLILRFGIIYGERTTPKSALEDIVHKAFLGENLIVGSFDTARRFIHVEDVCDAIIETTRMELPSETFNLAYSELITLKSIGVEALAQSNKNCVMSERGEKANIRNPVSDKFYLHYNWRPKIDLKLGVRRLMDFYEGKSHE
jgi:nucleoside-diphosphate-sugar epimerase